MRMAQVRLKPAGESWGPMRTRATRALRNSAAGARAADRARGFVVAAFVLACGLAAPARATQPFIWDQDTNGIDDRIESVHALGWSASFELSDTTLRQRIAVVRALPELLYEVYVRWDHTPTSSDVTSLTLVCMPVLARI